LPQRYRAGLPAAPLPTPAPLPEESSVTASAPVSSSAFDANALPAATAPTLPPDGVDLRDHIANIEINLIKQALVQANGVVAHAAKLLNTRRTTLVEKLRKYGLQRDDACEVDQVHL